MAGSCHPLPWLPGQPCAPLAKAKPFFPEGGTRKEAWRKCSALQMHPQGPSWASFNRFGEHGLVRCLQSCSVANPGLREDSQAIADSWVVTAA